MKWKDVKNQISELRRNELNNLCDKRSSERKKKSRKGAGRFGCKTGSWLILILLSVEFEIQMYQEKKACVRKRI